MPSPIQHGRSSRWAAVQRAFLEKAPYCAVCGGKEHLQVHHKKPFHLFKDLELVESNLLVLCESPERNHHLLFGHLLDWHAWNPMVEWDVNVWAVKIKERAYGNAV